MTMYDHWPWDPSSLPGTASTQNFFPSQWCSSSQNCCNLTALLKGSNLKWDMGWYGYVTYVSYVFLPSILGVDHFDQLFPSLFRLPSGWWYMKVLQALLANWDLLAAPEASAGFPMNKDFHEKTWWGSGCHTLGRISPPEMLRIVKTWDARKKDEKGEEKWAAKIKWWWFGLEKEMHTCRLTKTSNNFIKIVQNRSNI